MTLQGSGIPAVEGKIEFLLRGAKLVRGGQEYHPTRTKDAGGFLEAGRSFRNVLQEFWH
jgi:hypothetical protein